MKGDAKIRDGLVEGMMKGTTPERRTGGRDDEGLTAKISEIGLVEGRDDERRKSENWTGRTRVPRGLADRPGTLAAVATDDGIKLRVFLTDCGYFELLKEFEAYYASPTSLEQESWFESRKSCLEYDIQVAHSHCVKCLGDHGTAQCTRNKDANGPPTSGLCKVVGPRSASSSSNPKRSSAPDDLKQLISLIKIIDTNELAILAEKYSAAVTMYICNPGEITSALPAPWIGIGYLERRTGLMEREGRNRWGNGVLKVEVE
ncbi:hypothetical protein EVAR_76766_1 [Eumeta japonica]|uniref:Uncharacterized protein n=1 Tax=Eumeta variegata TaxID=151549 RepID=A0A4C1SSX6_EUMVA|nr:hypothetical protein EVAR_76766_1 [Eumeta japonica]